MQTIPLCTPYIIFVTVKYHCSVNMCNTFDEILIGSYMFVNGTSHGGNARLVSITETSRGKVCVSLFYCLLGNSTLRVLQQDSMSGNITVIDQRENTFNSTARSWMPLQISHEASKIWRVILLNSPQILFLE